MELQVPQSSCSLRPLSHTAVLRYVIVIIRKYCVDKTNATDVNKQYGVQWQRVFAENNLSFAAEAVAESGSVGYNATYEKNLYLKD